MKTKKVVILIGSNDGEIRDVYINLFKNGFNVEYHKIYKNLGSNIDVDATQREQALEFAIDYCIENNYVDMICVDSPCNTIKDIVASRSNIL